MTANKRNRYVKDVTLISVLFGHKVVLKFYAMKDEKYDIRKLLTPQEPDSDDPQYPFKSLLVDQGGFEADLNPDFIQLITYMPVGNVDDIPESAKASLRDIGIAFHSLEM